VRIAVGHIWQETNSFNPVPTNWDAFETFGIRRGEEMFDAGSPDVAGVLDACARAGRHVELVPLLAAHGGVGGPLDESVLRALSRELVERLQAAGKLDGVLLILHGACSSTSTDDVDGALLRDVRRAVGLRVPVIVALDHHANVTARMVNLCDALVAHRTEPHRPRETAALAMRTLVATASGQVSPVLAWQKIPMITHQERFRTDEGPMAAWFAAARAAEKRPGVLAVSTFPMQPWLDVPDGGWAAVAVTDGDPAHATEIATELAEMAWDLRTDFSARRSVAPREAIRNALSASAHTVVCDLGDAVLAGATGDGNLLLGELLAATPPRPVAVPIVDAAVAGAAHQAGRGATIAIPVGGTLDPRFAAPLEVEARVVATGDGSVPVDGLLGLATIDEGRRALLQVAEVRLLVSERRGIGGAHPALYRATGFDPGQAAVVVVKTAANVQHYVRRDSRVEYADTPGQAQSDLGALPWKRRARPLFGLDPLEDWSPGSRESRLL
jgi:microcystin degradation protein MlrC